VATSSLRGNTRVDHVLVCADHYASVTHHCVLDVLGSDHLPLSVRVDLPAQGARLVDVLSGLTPLPPSLLWRLAPEDLEAYQDALEQRLPQVDDACVAADACQAVDAVCEVVLSAAQHVGMRMVTRAIHPAPARRRHHPWFDEECRAAKAAVLSPHERSRPEAMAALRAFR
jgi:hypothetical protein